jgi:hypothetical protein
MRSMHMLEHRAMQCAVNLDLSGDRKCSSTAEAHGCCVSMQRNTQESDSSTTSSITGWLSGADTAATGSCC